MGRGRRAVARLLGLPALFAVLPTSCAREATPAALAPSRPSRSVLWRAAVPSRTELRTAGNSPDVSCERLSPPPGGGESCTVGGRSGLVDPEGRCDPELELARPLGRVWGRSFDSILLLARKPSGFWVLSSSMLDMSTTGRGPYPRGGVALTELSDGGMPLRQCFFRSHGNPAGSAGIRDAAIDSRGRVAITGWLWGSGLNFGGEDLSVPDAHRVSYAAVMTARATHGWSHALNGPSWVDSTSLDVDDRGNVVVTGDFFQELDLGAARLPAPTWPSRFVVKYDPEGRVLWARTSLNGAQGLPGAVAFLKGGRVALVGGYSRELDFGEPVARPSRHVAGRCGSSGSERAPVRMYWIELDAEGRELRSRTFGDVDAQAFDISVSNEGDVIVSGSFLGKLDLGRGALRASAPPGSCRCSPECAFASSRFVARFDARGGLLFQEALPDVTLIRATPGPARTTLLVTGIPVSFRSDVEGPGRLPADYRWVVGVRSASGEPIWKREFHALDVKGATPVGERIAFLVHAPDSRALWLLAYRPKSVTAR